MTEVLSQYGPIHEVWFDGSCVIEVGDILKQYVPDAMIFQGPYATIRWVGNERGIGPDPCWNAVQKADAASGVATAIHGDPLGDVWLPNEVDTTLFDHKWFWGENTDHQIKSLEQLMDIYYTSVGRSCVLLLNATPDTSGLIPESHVRRYAEFGAEIKRRFGQSIAQTSGTGELISLSLDQPARINHAILMEDIARGQRVRAYILEGQIDIQWRPLCAGTSIRYKKIDSFASVSVSALRLRIAESMGPVRMKQFAVFHAEPKASEPDLSRQDTTAEKTVLQEIGAWDETSISADWTALDIDLSPFIHQAGQYEIRFEKTSGSALFELQSPLVVLEGLPAPDFIHAHSKPNTFIVNRTAVVSADRKESTRLRVEIRRIGSGDCTVKAWIRLRLPGDPEK